MMKVLSSFFFPNMWIDTHLAAEVNHKETKILAAVCYIPHDI